MEKTYLSEVYDYFLSSISDYAISEKIAKAFQMDEEAQKRELEALEQSFFMYFKKARAKFYKCRQPLSLKEDENGEKYFAYTDKDTGEEIGVELTGFELNIITHLMLVEYMKQQLLATDVIKQSLSDKDFKIYSQANQLREINLLYRLLQRESRQMITEYTYMGMTDDVE